MHTPDLFDGNRFDTIQEGAAGALFFPSCVPVTEFSPAWPQEVPGQIHAAEAEPYFVDDGDMEAARVLQFLGSH